MLFPNDEISYMPSYGDWDHLIELEIMSFSLLLSSPFIVRFYWLSTSSLSLIMRIRGLKSHYSRKEILEERQTKELAMRQPAKDLIPSRVSYVVKGSSGEEVVRSEVSCLMNHKRLKTRKNGLIIHKERIKRNKPLIHLLSPFHLIWSTSLPLPMRAFLLGCYLPESTLSSSWVGNLTEASI